MKKSTTPIVLSPNEEKSLSELSCERIILRRVSSSSESIGTLFTPIKVHAAYVDGRTRSYYISASTYFSNRKPEKVTDLPMSEKIRDCQFTTISIEDRESQSKDYKLTIEFDIVEMIPELVLIVNYQNNGFVFALHPNSKKIIRETFPEAIIAGNLFVDHSTKSSFEYQSGNVLQPVFKALTGLNDDQIFSIKVVSILNSATNKIENHFDPNEQDF